MRGGRQSEQALIEKIRQAAALPYRKPSTEQVRLGIGDDAALFRPKTGYETTLTCDWFLEGTHFIKERHPPDAVGWKCLARALSDIAAMGGVPRCFLLSLALPASCTGPWLDSFLGGLRRASRKSGCVLAGGDTTRSGKILINVTVVGEVPVGRATLRSGARPGDIIYVSGHLGEAELGLRILREEKRLARRGDLRIRKHLYPEPRLALGQWLAKKQLVSAMMDLSDGLSLDLARLCAASHVGARVQATQVPAVRVPATRGLRGVDLMMLALHGGDDYELLFTVSRRSVGQIPSSFEGLRLTAIGKITLGGQTIASGEISRGRQVLLVQKDGKTEPLMARGWDPFR